jgi:protein TonB
VKRLSPAFICALALHAILLSTDFNWLMLAPSTAPASRSLSITLSADKLQKRSAQTAVPNNEPEKRFQPGLQQKLTEKPGPIPAAARLENSAQIQKQPARIPQKPRQKKNLKALTRKIKAVKATDATRAESTTTRTAGGLDFTAIGGKRQGREVPQSLRVKPGAKPPVWKTQSMTSAAALTSRQSDNSVSATALTMAKPLYRKNPAPAYPRKARRMGYEGIVMLKVLVDENGQVDDLMVLESSGYPILDHTALASVRKWLFEPGTEGGIKKKMWVRVPVRFRLK